SFEREFETYASDARVITIAEREPWYVLTAKHQLDQQKWQVLIWSENDQQFLPVRAVLNIQNQNTYNWQLNLNESGQPNSQLLLSFKYDFGTQSKIILEK
ncbi:MAG: hypothetical protein ACRCZC_04615, partial [Culicoidibacterales bacterium]